MNGLNRLFNIFFCFFFLAIASMQVSVADGGYAISDGVDQGYVVVKHKDVSGVDDWSKIVHFPSGEVIISTGEKFSLNDIEYQFDLIWGGNLKVLTPRQYLQIGFGASAKTLVRGSDEWSSWEYWDYVSGIFLKSFWTTTATDGSGAQIQNSSVGLVFKNGDSVVHGSQEHSLEECPEGMLCKASEASASMYPAQTASEVHSPKLVQLSSVAEDGTMQYRNVIVFSAVCNGNNPATADDDLGQCLLMTTFGGAVASPPTVIFSQRVLWGGRNSKFEELSWNVTTGSDDAGFFAVVITPEFTTVVREPDASGKDKMFFSVRSRAPSQE